MTRDEVMSFIDNSKKFGSKLELCRIEKLCELLGNPQEELKCIHIAGTNGKGSTSVFINNILIDSGFKVGLYTSPYIYEFNERIQINNEPVKDFELVDIMSRVSQNVDVMLSQGYEHPTEFELITAAAFLYFKEKKCDYVVLEVGLGGIYDATNIIKTPLLSVITSISVDHTDYLGNTIYEIAKNKCGIIKKNCPVVTYMKQDSEALAVIEKTAKEKNSSLTISDGSSLEIKKCSLSGNEFLYNGEKYETTLIGKYQIFNAITAINVAELLQKCGLLISGENVKNGLKSSKWHARFEILEKTPTIIADGSHNADGMAAFVETVKEVIDKKPICVFSMLKDKDYDLCLKMLSSITDTVIITEVESNPRRESVEKLAQTAKKYIKNVYSEKCNSDAMKIALSLVEKDGTIIALGSLYMMNNIKKFCNN
ncbi:MAG: bifunctional folylpolyglutamate synthase/dihydrofolate synthase [Clostridia bacterium]|nr:bifunctional folylpolyglutamate synthase/dihydrofolate synthase [Clostridia bacterium]